jgi:regulator of RNase E activity RraA
MLTLNEMPQRIDDALLERLERVDTATVGHFQYGIFMCPELRPVIPSAKAVGTAVTLRLPGTDSTLLHYAMGLVRPNDFVVIDRCGDHVNACWGGFMAAAAREAGLSGVVVDGAATDPAELRESGVPVWGRSISPVTTRIGGTTGELNVAIVCGGVSVSPGDVIVADESGLMVLAPDNAAEIAEQAIAMQEEEHQLLESLRSGQRAPDITGASEMIKAALDSDR